MAEETPRSRRRVAEAVEKGVEGLYDFLFRLISTFWLVSARPRACRLLIEDRHSDRARYVLPFTYAAVGTFLVSLVAGVAGYKILDWIWFDQEIPETIVERLSEGVSLIAIAAGSVPAFLFIIVLSGLLAGTLEGHRARSGRAMFVTCYAVGTQSIYLFLAAVIVSTAQLLPAAATELSWFGDGAEAAVGAGFALILVGCLAAALLLPVRFFIKSFRRPRRSATRRLVTIGAYLLISAGSIWALPFMAALPSLLAAGLKPSDEPTLTVESDPALYSEGGEALVAVELLIENRGSKLFGSSSADASATIRFGPEPLERETAGTISMEPVRIENEAGEAVRYTSAAENKLVWRRLIIKPAASEVPQLKRLASGSPPSCIQVILGSGDRQIKSVCVRRTLKDLSASTVSDEHDSPDEVAKQ